MVHCSGTSSTGIKPQNKILVLCNESRWSSPQSADLRTYNLNAVTSLHLHCLYEGHCPNPFDRLPHKVTKHCYTHTVLKPKSRTAPLAEPSSPPEDSCHNCHWNYTLSHRPRIVVHYRRCKSLRTERSRYQSCRIYSTECLRSGPCRRRHRLRRSSFHNSHSGLRSTRSGQQRRRMLW